MALDNAETLLRNAELQTQSKQYDQAADLLLEYFSHSAKIEQQYFKEFTQYFMFKVVPTELLKCDEQYQITTSNVNDVKLKLAILCDNQETIAKNLQKIVQYCLSLLPHLSKESEVPIASVPQIISLGVCYRELREFKKSGICFLASLTIQDFMAEYLELSEAEKRQIESHRASTRAKFANYYLDVQKYQAAIMWTMEALQMHQQIEDAIESAKDSVVLGIAYLHTGEHLKSIEVANKSLESLEQNQLLETDVNKHLDVKGDLFNLLGANLSVLGD